MTRSVPNKPTSNSIEYQRQEDHNDNFVVQKGPKKQGDAVAKAMSVYVVFCVWLVISSIATVVTESPGAGFIFGTLATIVILILVLNGGGSKK